MRTANPALSDRVFGQSFMSTSEEVMTLSGTVNKTLLAVLITIGAASMTWTNPELGRYTLAYVIGGLVVALIISFKQTLAPTLTPVYAALEGLFLGGISLFAETAYPGIVFQAVGLTMGTLFCLLMAYKSGLIRATENFKLGVVAATGAVAVFYLIALVLQLFHVPLAFMNSSSPLSILISGVVVVVAALNLVLDFDFIERAAERGNAPKYMEWYGAFGLLVTLVWLYLEILRLLMKLQDRGR